MENKCIHSGSEWTSSCGYTITNQEENGKCFYCEKEVLITLKNKRKCKWKETISQDGFHIQMKTHCGIGVFDKKAFLILGGFCFCPYCGKEIEEK